MLPPCLRFLLVFAVGSSSVLAASDRLVLAGDVLTPTGVIRDGFVTVADGHIEAVAAVAPAGLPVVQTHGVISPGFVDLHNHLTWNVFPRWKSGRKFPNRYEWQQYPEYLMALAGPHATLIDRGNGPAMARFAEVKALAGGATSLAGLYPGDLGDHFKPPYRGMMRMLDIGSGFYPDGKPEGVLYHVFPFFIPETEAQEIRTGLGNGSIHSMLIHLGEGSPVDAASINEFKMLKARGLLLPGVSLIHGVSLHRPEFEEMAKLGVGLVWSPRSNFELYGATADVAAAKKAGVKIAIAPDWSPTGSDGEIEELKYAAIWNATLDVPLFSDEELMRMATSIPAGLARVESKIGAIAPGLCADLVVLRKTEQDPFAAIVHAAPADLILVMVGGKAVYGDPVLARATDPSAAWVSIKVAAADKAVAFPVDPVFGSWAELSHKLDDELQKVGSRLGPIVGD